MHSAYLSFVFLAFCANALERAPKILIREAPRELGDATVEIVDKYYAPRAKVVRIYPITVIEQNKYRSDEAINYILNNLGGALPYRLQVIPSGINKNDSRRNVDNFNMFFVDGYDGFRRVWDAIIPRTSYNNGHFLIVFIGGRTWNEIEYEIERIFKDFWTLRIAKVYVIAKAENNEAAVAKLYTFFPYNEKSCDKVSPIVVNEYRKDGFLSELDVFVDKFRNMHQCPLSVVTPTSNQFITVVTDAHGNKYLDGFEGIIMDYLARAMNFRIDIKASPNNDIWRPFALEMFSNGSAEIAIGKIAAKSGWKTYSITFPHYFDSYGFMKPIGIPYTALEKLSMPFFNAVWLWLLIAVVAVSIVHYLVFGQSFFDQVDVVLNGSLTQMPRAIKARLLIGMWMLATLILRNAYQGALFDILQGQIRHRLVETIQDLQHFNYSIYCEAGMCPWLKLSMPYLQKQLTNFETDHNLTYYEWLRNESFRGVFVASELNTAHYNKLHSDKFPFALFEDRILSSDFVIFVKKDSCLVTRLNSHVHNLASCGLINYWAEHYLGVKHTKITQQKVPEKLTLSQLEGILYICAVLYAISCLVFVFEVILWKFQQ